MIKSGFIKLCRYLSISNEWVIVNTLFRRMIARDSDAMIIVVFPLLLPRFDKAIRHILPPLKECFPFLRTLLPSVYLSASIGDTRDAILAGCPVEMNTVTREKMAAPIKISGFAGTVLYSTISPRDFMMTGTSPFPTKNPASSPPATAPMVIGSASASSDT